MRLQICEQIWLPGTSPAYQESVTFAVIKQPCESFGT